MPVGLKSDTTLIPGLLLGPLTQEESVLPHQVSQTIGLCTMLELLVAFVQSMSLEDILNLPSMWHPVANMPVNMSLVVHMIAVAI